MTGVGCTHGASTAGCGSLFGASAPGWRGGVLCVLQQRVINKVRVEHQPVSYSPCIFAVSISRVHTHFFSLQCWNQANWTEVLLGSIPRSQDARVTTRIIIYMGRQLGGIFLISRPSFSTRSTWYTCLGNRMESHSIYVYKFIYRHAYIWTLICHEPASWVRGVFHPTSASRQQEDHHEKTTDMHVGFYTHQRFGVFSKVLKTPVKIMKTGLTIVFWIDPRCKFWKDSRTLNSYDSYTVLYNYIYICIHIQN